MYFCYGRGFEGEDVLLKKPLADLVFKVLAEGPTFDSSMSLSIMKGAIFFRFRKERIICYRLWALDPEFILDVLDVELQRSRVLTNLEGLERIWRKARECLLLVGALPPISFPGG